MREADALGTLRGCLPPDGGRYAGKDPEKFMAALASLNVLRQKPGKQRASTCKGLGKNSSGPDFYEYDCTVDLLDGRRYADRISCFDPPPYRTCDACTENEGFPRKPPRSLPRP